MRKKILLIGGTIATTATSIFSLVSCSLFSGGETGYLKSDFDFWNYESYMNDSQKDMIDEIYNFREFGDLPEFETGLRSKTAIGGVGSDYFNVSLAEKGLISKIDFNQIFPVIGDNQTTWSSYLKKIYSPVTWNILNSFKMTRKDKNGNPIKYLTDGGPNGEYVIDSNGGYKLYTENSTNANGTNWRYNHDIDGDGVDDQLWEYMIPYFVQNKVFEINKGKYLDKIKNKMPSSVYETIKNGSQQEIQDLFSDKSYLGILQQLNKWGFKNIMVNDYMRDNMIIGSEKLNNNKETTGNIKDIGEGKKQIDAFIETLNEAGFNGNNIAWETDGTTSFESALDKRNGRGAEYGIALVYNGDANNGYEGTENVVPDSGRIIIPKHSTFLLDGIVMASSIKMNVLEQNRFYQVVNKALTQGYNIPFGYLNPSDKNSGITENDINANKYKTKYNNLLSNYKYVAYTPAYKYLYNYAKYEYIGNPNGAFILGATNYANNVIPASNSNLSQVIPPTLQGEISLYYNEAKDRS